MAPDHEDLRRLLVKQLIIGGVMVMCVVIAAYLEREASSPDAFLSVRTRLAPRPVVRREMPWSENRIMAEATIGTEQIEHQLRKEWIRRGTIPN